MELYTDTRQVPLVGSGNLVAVGKWDGVHLAHQAIIEALVRQARLMGGQSVVMGFHPLPMTMLRPEKAPPMLQSLEERAETLAAMGVDAHLAVQFDQAFADLSPEEFVRDVLVRDLKARHVMVGFNFTFGRGGAGTASALESICARYGIPVSVFPPVRVNGETVSSTEVRFAVAEGEMAQAAAFLGRPFAVTGEVVRGEQRGRTIGYPTANVNLPERRQLPPIGVYVARVTVLTEGGIDGSHVTPRTGESYGAMLNLGLRPTFQGADLRCEAHLFDYQGDLYGRTVKVEFLQRLRGERPFSSIDALKAQLVVDEQAARAYLQHHE